MIEGNTQYSPCRENMNLKDVRSDMNERSNAVIGMIYTSTGTPLHDSITGNLLLPSSAIC